MKVSFFSFIKWPIMRRWTSITHTNFSPGAMKNAASVHKEDPVGHLRVLMEKGDKSQVFLSGIMFCDTHFNVVWVTRAHAMEKMRSVGVCWSVAHRECFLDKTWKFAKALAFGGECTYFPFSKLSTFQKLAKAATLKYINQLYAWEEASFFLRCLTGKTYLPPTAELALWKHTSCHSFKMQIMFATNFYPMQEKWSCNAITFVFYEGKTLWNLMRISAGTVRSHFYKYDTTRFSAVEFLCTYFSEAATEAHTACANNCNSFCRSYTSESTWCRMETNMPGKNSRIHSRERKSPHKF